MNGELEKGGGRVVQWIKWCGIFLLTRKGKSAREIAREFSGVHCDRGWIAERCFRGEVI